MSQTNTDQLYIDDDYLSPDWYYTYVAEAVIASSSTASISCDASVILGGVVEEASGSLALESSVSVSVSKFVGAASNMSVTATVASTISHIEGADLFVFSNAQLAADVAVIRSYNISSSSAFSIAVDAVRGIYISAQADSVASMSTSMARYRATEAAANAAFSLSSSVGVIEPIAASITSTASVSVDASITKSTLVDISSQASVVAALSGVTNASASLASEFSTTATFKAYPVNRTPKDATVIGSPFITSTYSKFGGSSAGFPVSSYLQFADSDDWNEDKFTADLWIYVPSFGTGSKQVFKHQGTGGTDAYLFISNLGRLTWSWTNTLGSSGTDNSANGVITAGSWNHIRVVGHASQTNPISVYANGTRVIYDGNIAGGEDQPNRAGAFNLGDDFALSNWTYYLDEYFFIKDWLNPVTDATITVPTQPYKNLNYTTIQPSLLMHFEDFGDDALGPVTYNSALQSTFNISAVGSKSIIGAAGISSQSNLTVNASKVVEASADFSSQFSQTAQVNETVQLAAELSTSSTLSSTVLRIRSSDASLSNAFTQVADPVATKVFGGELTSQTTVDTIAYRTRNNTVQTDAIFSELAAVAKIGDFLITMESQAALSSIAVKTTDVSSTQTATTALSADAIKAVDASSSMSANASQTADAQRLRSTTVEQSSEFTQTASLNIVHGGNSNLSSEFAVDAQATGEIRATADLSSTTSLSSTAIRIRFADSSSSSSFSTTATVAKTTGYSSSLGSNLTLDAIANRVQHATITTDSIASQLSAVAKTGRGFITCEVQATLVAGASIIAENEIQANISTQIAAVAVKTARASSTLSTVSSSSIEGTTNITLDADLSSEFALSCNADYNADAVSLVASSGTMTALVGVIKPLAATMSAEGFELAVGTRTVGFSAALTANASMTATLGGVIRLSASLQGFSAELVSGKIIHIDPDLTWIIPAEVRVYSIIEEDREYSVTEENRLYTITG